MKKVLKKVVEAKRPSKVRVKYNVMYGGKLMN